ncbi:MAG: ImmA/IrrE family metallo-endopeptidase [Peptococcia bacterium]
MQNGIVGSNTHRKLDINEFRGFVLYDEFAPLIFINTNDSMAGKIFTLVHEFIHILFEEDDILENIDLFKDVKLESQINKITVEFLMPEIHIKEYWDKQERNLNQIEKLSKLFNVSRLALAIRLKELDLMNQALVQKVNEVTKRDLEKKANNFNGGNYWDTYKSRYSNNFIETVIQGAESGEIGYNYALCVVIVLTAVQRWQNNRCKMKR